MIDKGNTHPNMNFFEIEKNLAEIIPSKSYGIDRFHHFLKSNPNLITIKPQNIILVAGTNGKGTVASMIAHVLIESGKKVGLFTSPHLIHANERIRKGLVPIEKTEYIEAFKANISLIKNYKLSYFESHLLMALWYFHQCIDYLVLEVGLGGAYDATNAIPHSYCIFTEFGLDHQNILGSSLLEIMNTKMGIIDQSTNPIVISYPFSEEGKQLINKNKIRKNATYFFTPEYKCINKNWKIHKQTIEIEKQHYALPNPTITYAKCTQLAVTALKALKIKLPPDIFISHYWPGRFEKLTIQEKTIILDIAHNEQAIKSLVMNLQSFSSKKPSAIIALSKDKNVEKILKILKPICSNILLTDCPFKPQQYRTYNDITYIKTPEQTFQLAMKRHKFIIVTGSSSLVGAFKKWINSKHFLS